MMAEQLLQEKFWKGEFGNEYIGRNTGAKLIASNLNLFSNILKCPLGGVDSIIEFGCNIGLNLVALHHLLPEAELVGVEINEKAFSQLRKLPFVQAFNESVYDFVPPKAYDLALTKVVLIHQPPEMLNKFYDLLYRSSTKYILIAEYYNPTPVEIEYRGNSSVLFKRDFAGDMLDRYPDLSLCDYGFVYRRDMLFPDDDITWFLLIKR